MSLEIQQIKEQFDLFAGQRGPATIVPATITAINADDTVAIVFTDGSTIDDVRLKSVIKNGNKILLIPELQSTVLVGKIGNSDEYIVLAVEAISEVLTKVGGVTYSINAEGFLMKKGNDTLKEILTLIVEAIQPIVVLYGNNPVYANLTQASLKIKNVLR